MLYDSLTGIANRLRIDQWLEKSFGLKGKQGHFFRLSFLTSMKLAEHLRKVVEAHDFIGAGKITGSFGVTDAHSGDTI